MAHKTFAAFVGEMAKMRVREARAVTLYAESRKEVKSEIVRHIEEACHAGKIDGEYRDQLLDYVQRLHEAYMAGGRVIDVRDPKDWRDLGNGARMRATHKDSELMMR